MPGAEQRRRVPRRDVLGGHPDRRARLAAQRLRRRFRHVDHVGRVDDAHVEIVCIGMSRELGANQIGAADQVDAETEVTRGRDGAIDGMGRRMIATHRINSNAHMTRIRVNGDDAV